MVESVGLEEYTDDIIPRFLASLAWPKERKMNGYFFWHSIWNNTAGLSG